MELSLFEWVLLAGVFLVIAILTVVGLTIFSRFGKRVLDKLQGHHDIFTEFMKHTKQDSEAIRQEVFKHRGQLEKHAMTLNSHEKKINDLHKCYVEKNP